MLYSKNEIEAVLHPDMIQRLYRTLRILREVVRIVFREDYRLNWSDPSKPYEGVMMHTRPRCILINPFRVCIHDGNTPEQLLDYLHGVAFHEAGHYTYTSSRTWTTVIKLCREFQAQNGFTLPENLLTPCVNWVEDGYIEGRVTEVYPGFCCLFDAATSFVLTDDCCRAIVQQTSDLWTEHQACGSTMEPQRRAQLVQACVNLLSALVHRPAQVAASVPTGLDELAELAQAIRAAGTIRKMGTRMKEAVAVTERLFRLLSALMDKNTSEDPHANAEPRDSSVAPGSNAARMEEVARAIHEALRNRISVHRDEARPAGKRKASQPLSRKQANELTSLELQDENTVAPKEGLLFGMDFDDNETDLEEDELYGLDEWEIPETEDWNLESCRVEVVDSSPDNLPCSEDYDLEELAATLFEEYRTSAGELKRRLDLHATSQVRVYGQLHGPEIDEYNLPLVATGVREIHIDYEELETSRLDLALLMDESGSMATENRWRMTAAAALALEYALRDTPYVRLRVYGYTSDAETSGLTTLYRHYDSAIPRLRRRQALAWCFPKANNADGVALAEMHKILIHSRVPEVPVCLLMISDGQPYAEGYEGESALAHVRSVTQSIIESGIRFAHLQIGPISEAVLKQMYGDRWSRALRPEEIPARIIELVMRWLTPD